MAPDPKSFLLNDELHAYLLAHSEPLDEIQRDLIAETAALGEMSRMQISPEEGALLNLLVRLTRARRVVEVGTFTGYSSLCMARGLQPDGRLLCCDVSEEWTSIASRYWARAGLADRIELVIAPAAQTLAALPAEATIDLSFIDADKASYATYFAELVERTRAGGLICVDNTLWSGRVVDPNEDDDDVQAIRAFNDQVTADPRVEALMLPIADGLTLLSRK
jgi:caffeoyl-CoA O-methyltransferase